MSKNMSSSGRRYEAAAEKFQETFDKYYNDEAFKQADEYARQKATEDAGYYKGIKEGTISVAKKLLQQKIDINVIIHATGLTKEEVEKL